jgi:hypothetical protein
MSQFKVGDWVECIAGSRDLTFGEYYEVLAVSVGADGEAKIRIYDDIEDYNYTALKFKMVEDHDKLPNDTYVIAKHSRGWLTGGSEYLILDSDEALGRYLIEDDDGDVEWVGEIHFTGEIVVKGGDDTSTTPNILPTDSAARKTYPVYSGFLKYFPDAMAMVSNHSYKGNQQHNPDSELHWDRSKSGDELDAMMRHIIEGEWESVAWRAMANLQKEIEAGYRGIDG